MQVSVPKKGGLNLAALTQFNNETKGLPSTVIHMLPVEVFMFVDMLPYYLLNRHKGKHIFWTAMGAILNLKHWMEEGLEKEDKKFLSYVISSLKKDGINELLASAATYPNKTHVALDIDLLKEPRFQVHDQTVTTEKFCQVLFNQLCYLKYKLVDWEGRDDFTVPAKAVWRLPPNPVYDSTQCCWLAVYPDREDESDDKVGSITYENLSQTEITSVLAELESCNQPQKRVGPCSDVEVEKKKVRLTDNELAEIIASAQYLCQDVDASLEPPIQGNKNADLLGKVMEDLESQSPYIQLAQSPPKLNQGESEPNHPSNTSPVKEDFSKVREVHFHLHLEGEGRKVISYEQLDPKTFKICID